MLDWRLLGASIAALLVVSSVFLGGVDFFKGIFEKISQWLQSSPLSGIFSQPKPTSKPITLKITDADFALNVEEKISIDSDYTTITGFTGIVNISDSIYLKEDDLTIKLPRNIRIAGIKFRELNLDSVNFYIESNISASNASLRIQNFIGNVTCSENEIIFKGNVSTIQANIAGLKWELS